MTTDFPAIGGGNKIKAREQAEAIIPLDPARGYAFLAHVLSSSSGAEGAIRAYSSALEHDPENTNLLYQLGMAHQGAEQWNEAFATFERVIRLDPEHQHAVNQCGRTGALSGHNLDQAALKPVEIVEGTAKRTFECPEASSQPYAAGAVLDLSS